MPQTPKKNVNLQFPSKGIVDGASHTMQPEGTTHDAKNVLPFDTEETRLRGGRRRGVSKLTSTPLASNNVQLMISTDITTQSGDLAAGGISQYSSDHNPYAGQLGIIDFSSLSDGTHLTSSNAEHILYGFSTTTAKNTGSGFTNVHLVDSGDDNFLHASFGAAILHGLAEGQDDERQHPVRMTTDTPGFLIKQTDDSGIPYLLVDPARFEFSKATQHGNRHTELSYDPSLLFHPNGNNAMENHTTDFRHANDSVAIWKAAHMFPEIDTEEVPWNSTRGKVYCSKMEFQTPIGGQHAWVDDNGTHKIRFVHTGTQNETDDSRIYDPWYISFTSTDSTNIHQFKFEDGATETLGLLFRVGADYQDVLDNDRDEWAYTFHKSTETDNKMAFYVYLERKPSGGYDGQWSNTAWDLKVSTEEHHQGPKQPGTLGDVQTITTAAISGDDTNYHTLEVRVNDNRVDIYLDGILQKHYENIRDTFPTITNTDANATDPAESFGYAGIAYFRKYEISRTADSGTSALTKKQLSYWCSYDYGTREVDGNSVDSIGTDDRSGSHSWRIRNLEWREANTNSPETRVIVAVSNGNVYESENGSAYTTPTAAQALDSSARIVDAVSYFQKVYLVDGRNYRIYDPALNTISDWDATGTITLPGGDGTQGLNGTGTFDENPRCSIIEVFNGRIVMAGKSDEPNNWFMSAIGDPLDWDINTSIPYGGAITGSSSDIGEATDAITALIPTTDDRLLVGGTNSIHALTGDPSTDSTQFISVSREIGIVGQDAWCYGPNKSVYFVGENGLYNLQPNEFDVAQNNRVSMGKLDTTFININFASNHCRLLYDHALYGVHIFLTPHTRNSDALKHYFYDTRSDSFWEMELPSVIGPTAAVDFQDLDPSSRKILLGGYDGHVRAFDSAAKDDDGTKIESHVWIGPLQIGGDREAKLTQLIAVLDEQTEGLGYEIYAADTVEAAKAGTPIVTGEWAAGRNGSTRLRVRGSAIFVRLNSEAVALPWALENITATLAVAGRVRQR